MINWRIAFAAAGLFLLGLPAHAQNGMDADVSGAAMEGVVNDVMIDDARDSEEDLKDQVKAIQGEREKRRHLREGEKLQHPASKTPHIETPDVEGNIEEMTNDTVIGASKHSSQDLKGQMKALQDQNKKKKDVRDGGKSGSTTGRYQKAEETLSHVIEKTNETEDDVSKNIK